MKAQLSKRLVLLSVIGTIVAMIFMAVSIVFPSPLLLVAAMSIGQGIAILSLALFLLAVALDLQASGESTYLNLPEEPPEAPAEEAPKP